VDNSIAQPLFLHSVKPNTKYSFSQLAVSVSLQQPHNNQRRQVLVAIHKLNINHLVQLDLAQLALKRLSASQTPNRVNSVASLVVQQTITLIQAKPRRHHHVHR